MLSHPFSFPPDQIQVTQQLVNNTEAVEHGFYCNMNSMQHFRVLHCYSFAIQLQLLESANGAIQKSLYLFLNLYPAFTPQDTQTS